MDFSTTFPEPKEVIGHDADSQQHQQRHDDAGTHSFILLLRWAYRGTQCSNSTSDPLGGPLP